MKKTCRICFKSVITKNVKINEVDVLWEVYICEKCQDLDEGEE